MTRLSIADLEVERADPLEYETTDGVVFTFQDPKTLDINLMMSIEELTLREQTEALIADGRWQEFIDHPDVDGYVIEALMKRFAAHYGMDELGNAGGLPGSSTGSGRPSRSTSPGRATPSPRSGKRGGSGSS